jgi:hypothetical protein
MLGDKIPDRSRTSSLESNQKRQDKGKGPEDPSHRSETPDDRGRKYAPFTYKATGDQKLPVKPSAEEQISPPLTAAMQRLTEIIAAISTRRADNTPGPSGDSPSWAERENRKRVQNDIWQEGLSENPEVVEVVEAIKREMTEGQKFQVHPIGKTPEMVKKVILRSGLTYIHKKSADEGARHEVAAYYVGEKVLGLKNTFPITVWRDNGSAQLWVDNLTVGRDQLPNNDARVVDYILGHQDRITGYVPYENKPFDSYRHGNINWGKTPESPCVLFDNESMFPQKDLPFISYEQMPNFIPNQKLLEKIRALNMDQLKDVPFISHEEKKYILSRCTNFIKAIDAYQSGNRKQFWRLPYQAQVEKLRKLFELG